MQEVVSCLGVGVKKTRAHPVEYLSKQFNLAEINYDIHDKEMLAIVRSFHAWETLLKSCQKQIMVWIDYKNLECFNSTKSFTRRQVRWAEFLLEFDFIIHIDLRRRMESRTHYQGMKTTALKKGVKHSQYSTYSNQAN